MTYYPSTQKGVLPVGSVVLIHKPRKDEDIRVSLIKHATETIKYYEPAWYGFKVKQLKQISKND